MKKTNLLQRVCSLVIIVSLFIPQSGFAQVAGQVNIAGYLSGIKNNLSRDKFRPLHLRYLQYLPAENGFKLLVDKGNFFSDKSYVVSDKNEKNLQLMTYDLRLNQETKKLMEYFPVGLRLGNESFWVNLRPDSPDNVIDDYLAQTDVGRIMLESDLQLKKDVSMMTSPETAQGKIYWDKLYKKAEELFGYENVTIPTLTRPWIVPGEVIISETADSAYIYKATLKVMLEEDYLKSNTVVGEGLASSRNKNINNSYEFKDPRFKELNTYSTQLIKELIIPELTQEVNSSKRYAQLRQVYYSLIMAQWFKQRFGAEFIVNSPWSIEKDKYIKFINSNNLSGLTSKTPWSKTTYYKEYQKSFKDGEYNVKQTVSTPTGQVIRSYFSGGEMLNLPKIVTGEIPVNNAASPVIFSLPAAASSAVNYRPEEIVVQKAVLDSAGEFEIIKEGQDFGLSAQTAVSSSLFKGLDKKTKWWKKFYTSILKKTEKTVKGKIETYTQARENMGNLNSYIANLPKDDLTIPSSEKTSVYSSIDDDSINTSEMEEKLRNLRQYLPNRDETIYQFGEFLSGRLSPEIKPEGFVFVVNLAICDLQKGVDGFTNKRINNKLVDYPSGFYVGLRMSIVAIAKAVASKDFADEVKEIYKEMFLDKGNNDSLQGSSSAVGSSPVGGIDFTAFPIITRAVSNLRSEVGGISMDRLLRVDLGRDWSEIERMVSSGVRISPERLKEYVQASCAQDAVGMDRDKVLLCISDRLKQEEECGLSSEPLVIDMLAVLQSTNSQAQLRAVFIGN